MRKHYGLNYSGCDPTLPPPLCYTVPPKNQALPTRGRLQRGGAQPLGPATPHLMADLTDPSTWQRSYRFT